jgi:small subunit ribosomal protein S1
MSESFAELFEESFASQQIKPGAIITGTVVAVNDDVVIISAGLKSEAVIPIEQFQNEKGEVDVSVGDEFEVALDAVEDQTLS